MRTTPAGNFRRQKNLIGAFYSPRNVFCETTFLNAFPLIEQLYGLVEIWKHALLVNNKRIVSSVEMFMRGDKALDYINLITFSLNVKKHFVEGDPWDRNGAHKALSLGHTLANALEANPAVRHGLAVFYGILFATMLSRNLRRIGESKYTAILKTATLFEAHFGQLPRIKRILRMDRTIRSLKSDKITSHGKFSFVLPTDDGYIVCKDIRAHLVARTINEFCCTSLQ